MHIETNEINFSEGFTRSNDIFNRYDFYKQIVSMCQNSPEDNLVFALDDRWGQGKTSFVKMMHGEITKDESLQLNAIYFDAYENDYYSDPFIPISAEFYSLMSKPQGKLNKHKKSFLQITKKVGAAALIGTLKAVITTGTGSIVNGDKVIDAGIGAVKSASESLTDSLEEYVEKKITAAQQEKNDIGKFRETLADIHQKTSSKTIFIVDELDRARPDFSLDLIERIKHLFSVKGVIFILVMNRGQFEKSIEKRYGGIDSKIYLNKFIDYYLSLPKIKRHDIKPDDASTKTTIYQYISIMPEALKLFDLGGTMHLSLSYLLEISGCSLRESEKCISLLNLFAKDKIRIEYSNLAEVSLAILIFLKVYDARLFDSFISKTITEEDFMKEINFNKVRVSYNFLSTAHNLIGRMITFNFKSSSDRENLSSRDYPSLFSDSSPTPADPFLIFKEKFENFSLL